MKKNLKKRRFLSMFVTACLFISPLAVGATAENGGEETQIMFQVEELPDNIKALIPEDKQNDVVYITSSNELLKTTEIDNAELYTIRTENPVTGEGSLIVHTAPVKYIDACGNLKFINTSMGNLGFYDKLIKGCSYTNAANSFTVKYGNTIDKGVTVDNDFFIAPIFNQTTALSVNDSTVSGYTTIENSHGKMVYPEAFGEGTTLEYINTEAGIKENIILERNIGQNKFDFTFKSSTHYLVLSEDKMIIYVIDKNNPEKRDYQFLDLYAYDSFQSGETEQAIIENTTERFRHLNEECYYELVDKGNGEYIITVVVPEEYLNHPEVVYPVTIDPSITANNSNAEDSFIMQSSPNSNYGTYSYLRFGYNNGKIFSYFRFKSLPSIPSGAIVTSAMLKFKFRSGQTTPTGDAGNGKCYRVTTHQWYETTSGSNVGITWNNQPYGNDMAAVSSHFDHDRYEFWITSMVREWYKNPSTNYGLDFTYPNETLNDYNSVVSSEGEADRAPILTVNYIGGPASGITNSEKYYIRSAQSSKYLDVDIHTNNVIQWPFHGCANQQWKVKYQSDGTYKIYTMNPGHNGKCLDIENLTNNNVDVYSDGSGEYLRWIIVPNGDGSYRLYNKWGYNVDKVMTIASDGNVYQAVWTGASNQKWYFEKATTKFTSMNTFSSFSIGNDNMSGYNYFNNYLEGRTLNSKQYYPLIRFNYTNGQIIKNDIIEYLSYSDVAYIDSHAYATYIEMRDNSNTVYDKFYLSSDIGTSFKAGSTTKTNTPFNKKAKWLIIQACSQLNYTAGASDNSALQWVKALLGDGVRMHGVLSYYGSAPAGDIAGSRMNTFMGTQTNSSNRPNMITGWKLANEELIGSSAWAGICHRENLDDKLYWGWTTNTANGSAYTIDRYSYKQGTQKPLPLSMPKISTNSGSTIGLLSESKNVADQTFSLMDKTFTASQLEKLENTFEPEKISISPEGKLAYLNNSVSPTNATSALTWTEAQTISIAKEYLDTLGLLPQDDYLIKTSTVVREELDVFNETAGPAETVSWTIRFYQTYNGVPVVSKDNNGIIMTVSENGLHSLQYNWKNIVPAAQTMTMMGACVKTLSENEAIEKYCNEVNLKKLDFSSNISYRQVYLYQDNEVIPAWVFGTEDAFFEPVYINTITGDKLR